jgi:hypothetical protein
MNLPTFQEYEHQEKTRMIDLILDHADEATKARVTPLLLELSLNRLLQANPYRGNDSDDCHTFS